MNGEGIVTGDIMNSSVKLPPKPKKEFPCLKICNKKGTVVLFTTHGKGMVVFSKVKGLEVGYHSTVWMMSDFNPFDGIVTLSN